MKKLLFIALAMLLSVAVTKAQLSIENIQITAFNVNPESFLSSIINNSAGKQGTVEIIANLYNSDNQLLLTVKSAPFTIQPGFNTTANSSRRAISVEYSSTPQANYLKTTHNLPSGNFNVCVKLNAITAFEKGDEFCDEIESDHNQYLYLVSPADKDSMEIKNPMLVWAHSEPFNILSKNESFMMIVTEMKTNQSPEEAILMNTPIMTKQNLTTHNLQYPYEAKPLEEGKHYAWMVQKLSNGVVVAKTEVWEFSIIKKKPSIPVYAVMRTQLDADYYIAENEKVFFLMDDRYADGEWKTEIIDNNGKVYSLNTVKKDDRQNEKSKTTTSKVNYLGNGGYEIDLDKVGLSNGFHVLEITNEKGEIFKLKFLVQ